MLFDLLANANRTQRLESIIAISIIIIAIIIIAIIASIIEMAA